MCNAGKRCSGPSQRVQVHGPLQTHHLTGSLLSLQEASQELAIMQKEVNDGESSGPDGHLRYVFTAAVTVALRCHETKHDADGSVAAVLRQSAAELHVPVHRESERGRVTHL